MYMKNMQMCLVIISQLTNPVFWCSKECRKKYQKTLKYKSIYGRESVKEFENMGIMDFYSTLFNNAVGQLGIIKHHLMFN